MQSRPRNCPRDRSRNCSRALLTVLAALACALPAPALAQDSPPPPPPPKKSDRQPGKDRIRIGEDPQPETPSAPAPTGGEEPKQEQSEIDVLMATLAKWPSNEARQASIRLAAQPTVAYPILEKKLRENGQDWRIVAGAAATLGKIGDARAIEPIQAKLQDRSMYTHSGDLLDALVRIDPAGAKARLLGQLLHPAASVVDEAALRLESRVAPPDVPAIRDVIEAGGPSARAAAMRLLSRADPAEARTSLVARLRDTSPDVAMAAARALANDDSDEALTLLQRSAQSPVDRQLAYAAIALSLRGERTGKRTIDEGTLRHLLSGRGLTGVEPLNRAAAAVALADLGYFHEVPAVEEILESRVVPELVDIVAGRKFWPDQTVFQSLAVRRLQRLSGRPEISGAQEWVAWWEQSGSQFRARRVLLDVPDDAVQSFSFSVRGEEGLGGEPVTFAASAEGLSTAAPDDVTLMMNPAQAQSLLASLRASGLLTSMSGIAFEDADVPLQVVIRSGRRERRMIIPMSARTPEVAAFLAEALKLRDELAWQRYRVAAQAVDLPSFVALYGKKFAPGMPAAERNAAMADLISGAIDEKRGEAFNVRALEELAKIEGLSAALGDEGARRLLSQLGKRKDLDVVAEGLVRALAMTGRSEVHPLVLDFLLTRPSVRAQELMALVFRHASRDDLVAGLKDERPAIRRAALASLETTSPQDVAEPAVRANLEHPDFEVRREAVRSLGRLRFEWAREDLKATAGKPGPMRGAATEALGALGGKDVLPVIMGVLATDDVGLRVVAIRALGATREPEGLSAIAWTMGGDPDALVREVADKTMREIGTERAASELRRLALDRSHSPGPRARAVLGLAALQGRDALRDLAKLVSDPAEEVGDEAALALAKWRDPAGIERLLQMLDKGRNVRQARAALEGISLEVFGQDEPQTLANLYAGWWETSKDRGPRGWLVDALTVAGIDEPGLRSWEAGGSASAAVPALLKGLDVDNWAVRRAIDLVFRELASRDYGTIERWTSSAESDRIAASWKAYWSRQMAR